jgi:hypothetical protein
VTARESKGARAIADLMRVFADEIRRERAACVRDACGYCAGRLPKFARRPVGPNSAANWTHSPTPSAALSGYRVAICEASNILSRHRFGGADVDQLLDEMLAERA